MSNMSNMVIEVEFLAGTSLMSALEEAQEKSISLDVSYIHFSFNGAKFYISRKTDVECIFAEWMGGSKEGYFV